MTFGMGNRHEDHWQALRQKIGNTFEHSTLNMLLTCSIIEHFKRHVDFHSIVEKVGHHWIATGHPSAFHSFLLTVFFHQKEITEYLLKFHLF